MRFEVWDCFFFARRQVFGSFTTNVQLIKTLFFVVSRDCTIHLYWIGIVIAVIRISIDQAVCHKGVDHWKKCVDVTVYGLCKQICSAKYKYSTDLMDTSMWCVFTLYIYILYIDVFMFNVHPHNLFGICLNLMNLFWHKNMKSGGDVSDHVCQCASRSPPICCHPRQWGIPNEKEVVCLSDFYAPLPMNSGTWRLIVISFFQCNNSGSHCLLITGHTRCNNKKPHRLLKKDANKLVTTRMTAETCRKVWGSQLLKLFYLPGLLHPGSRGQFWTKLPKGGCTGQASLEVMIESATKYFLVIKMEMERPEGHEYQAGF